MTSEFPAQRASNAEYVQFDDVIMTYTNDVDCDGTPIYQCDLTKVDNEFRPFPKLSARLSLMSLNQKVQICMA